MKLAIFAKTFPRNDIGNVLETVIQYGFDTVHFNMACASAETMPRYISDAAVDQIKSALKQHNVGLCGISATFNAIHPDRSLREDGIQRFKELASKSRRLGSDFLTLCTGTRNAESMWEYHPQNDSTEAWRDLVETVSHLVRIADEFDVRLGIEPEINNVVCSPAKAVQLIREIRSPRLRVIIDPANIFRFEDIENTDRLLRKAFEFLGPYIGLAHAKDIIRANPVSCCAAGKGILDFALYIKLLRESGYDGPLVLHGLSEQEVPESVRFLQSLLSE